MLVDLIAVQAEMRLEHYLSREAFAAKVLALGEAAVAGLEPGPRLLAFPETIGLPLLVTLAGDFADGLAADAYEAALAPPPATMAAAALAVARRRWPELLRLAWRWRRFGPGLLYLLGAVPAYRAYRDAFAEVARRTAATVVAGTIFLPHVEEEAARGVHVADPRVHNSAFVFSPGGAVLGRVNKVYLTPGAESRAGLGRGRLADLPVFDTPAGRLGVAICLDGWYQGVLERLDGLGAVGVVQPSANHAPWERRWPPDPALSEGAAWLQRGLRAGLQGRQWLRFGVNPMMVGEVFGLAPRGRSSIVVNRRFYPDVEREGLAGVLALAESSDREEIVRARLDLSVGPVVDGCKSL